MNNKKFQILFILSCILPQTTTSSWLPNNTVGDWIEDKTSKNLENRVELLRNKTTISNIKRTEQSRRKEASKKIASLQAKSFRIPQWFELPYQATDETIQSVYDMINQSQENLKTDINTINKIVSETESLLTLQQEENNVQLGRDKKYYHQEFLKLKKELEAEFLRKKRKEKFQHILNQLEAEYNAKQESLEQNEAKITMQLQKMFDIHQKELLLAQEELKQVKDTMQKHNALYRQKLKSFESIAHVKIDTLRTKLQKEAVIALLKTRQKGSQFLRNGKGIEAYQQFDLSEPTWLRFSSNVIVKIDATHKEVTPNEPIPFSITNNPKGNDTSAITSMVKDYLKHHKGSEYIQCLENSPFRCEGINVPESFNAKKDPEVITESVPTITNQEISHHQHIPDPTASAQATLPSKEESLIEHIPNNNNTEEPNVLSSEQTAQDLSSLPEQKEEIMLQEHTEK